MPRAIRSYVMMLALLATGGAGWLLTRTSSGTLGSWELVVLACVTVGAALVPVRFVHDRQTQAFTLEGGAVVALLLSGYATVAPTVMMGASLLAHGVRSRSAVKTTFNVARSGVETVAASAMFLVLASPSPSPTDPRSVAAVLAAVIAFEVTSLSMTTELMARLGQSSRRAAFQGVKALWAINMSGNTCYGIVLSAVVLVELWIAVLAGLLMLVMYLGYRGYASAIRGERRARALNEMTSMLIDLPAMDGDVHAVLDELLRVFEGQRGVLAVETSHGFAEWRCDAGSREHRLRTATPRTGLVATAMARGVGIIESGTDTDASDAIAAPILRGGEAVGAVAISGRRGIEPWSPADVSLLTAVANELAVALHNVALFQQVEEERARLEAESTKLHDILTAATDGIVSVLADGTIESWNPGMAQITGVEPDVAIGQPWHAVLRLKDADGSELPPTGDHVVSRAMAGQHAGEALSLQALRADGVWRWLQCTSSPVRHPDGRHRGVVLVARDVTTMRELEELKTDFIATVSHELRTPLTPLKGFLATLRNPRTALTEDQVGAIHGAMGSQLTRLETLIADLLAVAELDHGRFELRPEPLDLSEVVADAVDVEAADERSRCALTIEPGVTAVADHVALVRIVRSLVSNALKHTAGEVEVVVRTADERAEVVVRDEGPGIAPWDQQRVFNRFERLGNHLQRTQGPGLGLTIARSLARRMGGDVTLSSDIGVGASFVLDLPRARPRPVALRAVREA